jgi:DNA repair protein RecN (Recombination protein N)
VLTELRIRNFAIIESLALRLTAGFNVLTGETGAGKSIIVGALGFLLGERTGTDVIRTGADRGAVEGVFDTASRSDISALCDERGIPLEGDLLILRREVARTGRTRAWVNDTATTSGTLAELGRMLVSLHGQHAAQTLVDPESQRLILDDFGGAQAAAARVKTAFDEHASLVQQIHHLESRRAEAARRSDYLRHVAQEIEGAALQPGEEDRIEEESHRLEHSDELRNLAESALAELEEGEEALLTRLASVARSVGRLEHVDSTASPLREMLDSAFNTLQELARDVRAYGQSVELDPARLVEVQKRRDLIYRLTTKYGPGVEDVLATGRKAREELDVLDAGHLDLRTLAKSRDDALGRLTSAAAELTSLRKAAAGNLAREVTAVLPSLGMPDARFEVALCPRESIAAAGAEDVEFVAALNVGHESRSLAKTASGGELSRVMLALETIVARLDHTPTLIFDEVDAGIGGAVGLAIGDTMRAVASEHQVLAITHLAQIAARAHYHIVVSKDAKGGVTAAETRVVELDERIQEISRMLGGDPAGTASLAHARELVSAAATSSKAERSRRGRRAKRR